MAGSIVDITDGKIAQNELRKLSLATEHSPASVVITAMDGTIEYVNATFCEVTGYSVQEAIGQNPRVLKSGNLDASFYKELWQTILAGKTWKGDFINKRKVVRNSGKVPLFHPSKMTRAKSPISLR